MTSTALYDTYERQERVCSTFHQYRTRMFCVDRQGHPNDRIVVGLVVVVAACWLDNLLLLVKNLHLSKQSRQLE